MKGRSESETAGVEKAADDDPRVTLCSFRVAKTDYVLDIHRVREIVRPLPITPVARGSARVEGVIDLRGEVVPVIDLRRQLGGRAPEAESRTARYLIVRVQAGTVALVVDAVGRVYEARRSQIQQTPLLDREGSGDLFPGVVSLGGHLHVLLGIDALLEASPDLDLEALAAAAKEAQ